MWNYVHFILITLVNVCINKKCIYSYTYNYKDEQIMKNRYYARWILVGFWITSFGKEMH